MAACLKPVARVSAALQAKSAGPCFTTHFTGLDCPPGVYALDLIDAAMSAPLLDKVGENCKCGSCPASIPCC